MPTIQRELRTARVNMLTAPSKKRRWESIAALRGYSLTRLIEDAMEREEAELLGDQPRRRVTR